MPFWCSLGLVFLNIFVAKRYDVLCFVSFFGPCVLLEVVVFGVVIRLVKFLASGSGSTRENRKGLWVSVVANTPHPPDDLDC